jgi:hypothetical protein
MTLEEREKLMQKVNKKNTEKKLGFYDILFETETKKIILSTIILFALILGGRFYSLSLGGQKIYLFILVPYILFISLLGKRLITKLDENSQEKLKLFFLFYFLASLAALHKTMTLLNHMGDLGGFVDSFIALLQGSMPMDPMQTRLFVPLLLYISKLIIPSDFLIVFSVEFISTFFAFVSFYLVSGMYLKNKHLRVISLLLFSCALLSSIMLIRLGDYFGVGFFLCGLWLFEKYDGINLKKYLKWLILICFVVTATLARYDLLLVVFAIVFFNNVFKIRKNNIDNKIKTNLMRVIALGALSLSIMYYLVRYFNVHETQNYMFYTEPGGILRIMQIFSPWQWFIFFSFLSVFLIGTVIYLKEILSDISLNLKIMFFATVLYSVFLFFIGNFTEYRLFLPLMAVLIIVCMNYYEEYTHRREK